MTGRNSRKLKIAFICGAILGITLFHYSIGISPLNHQIYGKFYYAPIISTALWFGTRGGLYASLIISLLLVPHFFIDLGGNGSSLWGILLEIPALNLVGFMTGYLRDKEQEGRLTLKKAAHLISLGKASSHAAHEMKNIGLSIYGFAKLIGKKANLAEDTARFLRVIEDESLRMERLAKDMLQFLRHPILKMEKVDLKEFLGDFILMSQEMTKQKGIEFHSEIQSDLPSIWLDSDRIKEVMINLLQNAIHATPAGGMIIAKTFENNQHLKIQIMDTGIGIPPENLDKVFLPFFTTKAGGSGLGLAISKKIIEAHGGTIEFESMKGIGTWVTITLPRNYPHHINDKGEI